MVRTTRASWMAEDRKGVERGREGEKNTIYERK